jgi:trehalose 6-phosphate synthase/phosphatase
MTISLKKQRIINVTHQIPYEIAFDNGTWNIISRRGHGAMYGGIHSLQKNCNILYIGWTGQINYYANDKEEKKISNENFQHLSEDEKNSLSNKLKEDFSCIPLFVDSESVSGHYDGYCKTSKVY